MRMKVLAIAGVLALAGASGAQAQQTWSGQDDQAAQTRQTTSADWSSSTTATPPEQASDLYQGKRRDSGNFGGSIPPDNNVLPGALNPDTKSLDNGKQSDPRE